VPYVPTPLLLKLQSLWDDGFHIARHLDDLSWMALLQLPVINALRLIDDTVAHSHRTMNALIVHRSREVQMHRRGRV
jgi:hypothetical protein